MYTIIYKPQRLDQKFASQEENGQFHADLTVTVNVHKNKTPQTERHKETQQIYIQTMRSNCLLTVSTLMNFSRPIRSIYPQLMCFGVINYASNSLMY